MIVPALNKHDYRHRFSACMIVVTFGTIRGAQRLTIYPDVISLGKVRRPFAKNSDSRRLRR